MAYFVSTVRVLLLFTLRLKYRSATEYARPFTKGDDGDVTFTMQNLLRSFHDLAVNDTTAPDLRTYLRAYLVVQASTAPVNSTRLVKLRRTLV